MTLVERLKEWLGDDGQDFFTGLKRDHGAINVVLPSLDGKEPRIPHPVHFREGMTVRNWLRQQPECQGWDAHQFDDRWVSLVEEALGI